MTRRKGEIGRSQLDRWWPHHVALPAEAVRGLANDETVRGFAARLNAAPLTYPLRRNDVDRVVFCFVRPGNAREFAMRFGGEVLPVAEKPGNAR
jgi:hypothetical protein